MSRAEDLGPESALADLMHNYYDHYKTCLYWFREFLPRTPCDTSKKRKLSGDGSATRIARLGWRLYRLFRLTLPMVGNPNCPARLRGYDPYSATVRAIMMTQFAKRFVIICLLIDTADDPREHNDRMLELSFGERTGIAWLMTLINDYLKGWGIDTPYFDITDDNTYRYYTTEMLADPHSPFVAIIREEDLRAFRAALEWIAQPDQVDLSGSREVLPLPWASATAERQVSDMHPNPRLPSPSIPTSLDPVMELRKRGLRIRAALVEYMQDRNNASCADIAEHVHGNEQTSDEAIRTNVKRTNNDLIELGVPVRFRVSSGFVFKESLPG